VALHGAFEKSPAIEWAFGVFNGTGEAVRFGGTADPETRTVTGSFQSIYARVAEDPPGRLPFHRGLGYAPARRSTTTSRC
jgi:hypothetical protein